MRREKGVITVFLALIFSVMITFLCATVDVTRINSAKNQLIVAVDAAITSTLSKFNKNIYEHYGIMVFDSNSVDENQFKSIVDNNLSKSNLFNINVENLDIKTGGSPFTNNDIMKKQMILSMKYQGTENLAMSVFDKVKQFLSLDDIAKDNDLIRDIEDGRLKKQLDKNIDKIQVGKLDALKAVISLAKNNKYDIIDRKSMDYRIDIYKSQLDEKYEYSEYSESVKRALNSIGPKEYNKDTYLQKGYSYVYTLTMLKMYSEYLGTISQNIPSQDESNSTNENETDKSDSEDKNSENELKKIQKRKDIIDEIIENIQKSDAFKELDPDKSKLIEELNKYIKGKGILFKEGGINNAIDAVNDLITKRDEYLNYLDQYNNVTSDDFKKIADETLKEYEKLLDEENLKDNLNQLESVKRLITNLQTNMKNIKTPYITWDKEKSDNTIFETIDKILGEDITAESDINKIVKDISTNDTLLKCSQSQKIAKDINQIDTLSGLKLDKDIMKLEYKENADEYKELFNKFKETKDKPNLTDIIKHYYKSENFIESSNLPNSKNEENSQEDSGKKISSEIGKVSELENFNDLSSVLDEMGDFADKLYLVEYIMTNFKDITDPTIGNPDLKRIPEETKNSTTLEYEIEAIISGKYDDKESKLTMADEIFAIRFAMNTISLVKDKNKMNKIRTMSLAISTASQGTIPQPLAKYTMIAGWATIESRYDVIDTLLGYDVALIKDTDNWISDFGLGKGNSVADGDVLLKQFDFEKESIKKDDLSSKIYNDQSKIKGISLNYPDYLRFKLLTMNQEKMINAVQDLIVENEKIHSLYKNYSTEIEATVNESNVNILFNTEYFTNDKNKFNKFTFRRGYN